MKTGIITLVSDNYGNKYQNYAVEQLLSQYGEVETFGLENLYSAPAVVGHSFAGKLSPSHIREVLISRPMYRYDINCVDKGVIHNLIYTRMHRRELLWLREKRKQRFAEFAAKYLHIAKKRLNHENTGSEWARQYDCFVCGSDQIWNPSYATTSELAFCSFAPEKTICLSPSFGVAQIPQYRKAEYASWLAAIRHLSVRETAGQKIIRDLTGRDAPVFLDPTMLIPVDKWHALCAKPQVALPEKYIVCYLLGRITKTYRKQIQAFAKAKNLPIVMLFDIMTPQYYTMDPAEVLYTIRNAEYVLTDSFHGSVFSILFHRNFQVFKRDEGGNSMHSRLDTLLNRFGLTIREDTAISGSQWENAERTLGEEREIIREYLDEAINGKWRKCFPRMIL